MRGTGFPKIRSRNRERIDDALARGRIDARLRTRVTAIHAASVEVEQDHDPTDPEPGAARASAAGGGVIARATTRALAVDDVFVLIGGTPPFEVLRAAGVSFDASLRKPGNTLHEQGTGLARALAIAFGLAFATLLWALWHVDYYSLALADRPAHLAHQSLRPGLGLGLAFGIAASVMIVVNLLYLLRRSPRIPFHAGSLQLWMTSHIATGVLALLLTMLHAGMAPKDTSGGHAFWALAVLLGTGAIGRYFYSYLPRAANGRELEVHETRARITALRELWGHDVFAQFASAHVDALMTTRQWSGNFLGRAAALLGLRLDLRRALRDLRREGSKLEVSGARIDEICALARNAHGAALAAAHFEDLRAIMNTWRWVHRWGAALMLVLLGIHIVHALLYGSIL